MRIAVATLAFTLLAGYARGQQADDSERRIRWRYFAEVPLKTEAVAGRYDFVLTPPVFDGARVDLADLRLYDAKRREIPYALRVRRPVVRREERKATEFNRATLDDGARQVTLELSDRETAEHNQVDVHTTGADFRRRVRVEGSDDGTNWKTLNEAWLLAFQTDRADFTHFHVDYPHARYRHLRVTVWPDAAAESEPKFEIRDIGVRYRVRHAGEIVIREAGLGHRQPMPTDNGPGSMWLIELGGVGVPVSELRVTIEDADFVRDFVIEASEPSSGGDAFYPVTRGVWRRKAGADSGEFVASLGEEITALRLKLLVTDYRNPPLNITSARYAAAARQVVFTKTKDGEPPAGPVRLYFGNPDARPPQYDFARNLPPSLPTPPARQTLQSRQENPEYALKPPPLTERLPWLVHVALGAAIAVLAGLAFSLARAALRQERAAAARE